MYKIAITGNTYSGYETVTKMFESKGVKVFDADLVLKFLLNYRTDLLRQVRIQLGGSVFDENSFLIADKFNTTEKFDKLLDIVWKEVIFLYEKWRLKYSKETYTLFKCAVVFEYNKEKDFDRVIHVYRPKDERMQDYRRNEKDGNIYAYINLSKEYEDTDKNSKTGYVINNYPSYPSAVSIQVDKMHSSFSNPSYITRVHTSQYSAPIQNPLPLDELLVSGSSIHAYDPHSIHREILESNKLVNDSVAREQDQRFV